MRVTALLATAALILGAPVLTDQITNNTHAAAFAKGGNGGGNGGGGNGGGNGGGKGADKGGNSGGKSAGNGRSKASSGNVKKSSGRSIARSWGQGSKVSKSQGNKSQASKSTRSNSSVKTATTNSKRPPELAPRTKNLHAQLKGLNSLNRNINGLMNSSDPKMEGFRDFVEASAENAAAELALEEAIANYATLSDDLAQSLDLLGLDVPTTQDEFDALSATIADIANTAAPQEVDFTAADGTVDLDAYDKAVSDWTGDVTAATAALGQVDATSAGFSALQDAETEVETTAIASSEEAMIDAIVAGMNATGNSTYTAEDITPEMVDWVGEKLGVGEDQTGLIDDYIAQQDEPSVTTAITPEEDEILPVDETTLVLAD
ncbi:hypothetical protein [Sulfitobacter sp. MF3-043]|uniref:hypothetical protein n=1 Tax=Sulfitobacter sediminivivens TaxID=3252902 RepID=UPI0036DE3067